MIEKKSKNTDLSKIRSEVVDLKKVLMNFKFQKSTGQLEKTSEIKKTKQKIARLKTNITKILGDKMPKRILSGTVISSNSNKTIVVKVTRRVKHKLYKKIISLSKNYHVHDEDNEFKSGDIVNIIESKPISKLKKWIVFNNKGDQQ